MIDTKEEKQELNNTQSSSSLKLNVDSKANTFSEEIENADIDDLRKRHEIVKRVDNYGADTLAFAEARSKSLSSTISNMTISDTDDKLYEGIENLEKEIKSIDPSKIDFSKVSKGLGKLFSPVAQYFNRLEHEDEKVEDLLSQLNASKSILINDNITLGLEIDKISDTIHMLKLECEIGEKVKSRIQNIINEAKQSEENDSKIKFYEEEVVIPLEKKLYDLKQVIIVNEQSMMAMEIIRKNNKELIRNVDRIKNVTLVALNTAVVVAKSIYNQKIILKKLQALEDATKNTIDDTRQRLSTDGVEVAKEIKKRENSIEGMKEYFNDAFNLFEEVKKENTSTKNEIELAVEKFGGTI